MAGPPPTSGRSHPQDRPRSVGPPASVRSGRPQRADALALVVQFGSFVLVLGIPDGVIGVLWPSMRQTFHLPLDALGALTVAATVLYAGGGLVSHRVRLRLDVGRTMVATCVVGVAALALWGAAPTWLLLLAGVALLGLARGVIDAVLNAEAALDGGVRRLGLLHASWAVGGTLGPVLVAAVLASTGDWRISLFVVAVGAALITPVAVLDRHRTGAAAKVAGTGTSAVAGTGTVTEVEGAGTVTTPVPVRDVPDAARGPVQAATTRHRRRLGLTVLAFAVYTAAEGGPIAWGYSYLLLDRHVSHLTGAVAMAAFWAALTLGRFGLAVAGERANGPRLLEWSCVSMVLGTGLFWLLPGDAGIAGLPIAGLGAAAVFPLLVALTPTRLGTGATSRAVGASIAAAAIGGPVAVAVFGVLASDFGVGVLGACLFAAAAAMYVLNRVLTIATRQVAP